MKSNPSDSGETEEDNGESGVSDQRARVSHVVVAVFVVSMAAALPALPKVDCAVNRDGYNCS